MKTKNCHSPWEKKQAESLKYSQGWPVSMCKVNLELEGKLGQSFDWSQGEMNGVARKYCVLETYLNIYFFILSNGSLSNFRLCDKSLGFIQARGDSLFSSWTPTNHQNYCCYACPGYEELLNLINCKTEKRWKI